MKKGDIVLVLVPFPFSDLTGSKMRPALVLARYKREVIVVFMTSNLIGKSKMDILVEPNDENGLKSVSLIKSTKIMTLRTSLMVGKIGRISSNELIQVEKTLKELFEMS